MKVGTLLIFFCVLGLVMSCEFGEYRDESENCVQCVTGCPVCTKLLFSQQECAGCGDGSRLSQTFKQCIACGAGQLKCDDENIQCHPQYKLIKQKENMEQCMAAICSDKNCLSCASLAPKSCQQCLNGYSLSNGECIKKMVVETNSKEDSSKLPAQPQPLSPQPSPIINQKEQDVINAQKVEADVIDAETEQPIFEGPLIDLETKPQDEVRQTNNLQQEQDKLPLQTQILFSQLQPTQEQSNNQQPKINQQNQQQTDQNGNVNVFVPFDSDQNLFEGSGFQKFFNNLDGFGGLDGFGTQNGNFGFASDGGRRLQAIQTCANKIGYVPSQQTAICTECSRRCLSCFQNSNQCIECGIGYRRIGWKCISNESMEFNLTIQGDQYEQFEKKDSQLRQILLQKLGEIQNVKKDNLKGEQLSITGFNRVDDPKLIRISGYYQVKNEQQFMSSWREKMATQLAGYPIKSYSMKYKEKLVNSNKNIQQSDDDEDEEDVDYMKQSRVGIYIFIGLITVFIIAIIVFYCRNKKKLKQQKESKVKADEKQKQTKTAEGNQKQESDRQLY